MSLWGLYHLIPLKMNVTVFLHAMTLFWNLINKCSILFYELKIGKELENIQGARQCKGLCLVLLPSHILALAPRCALFHRSQLLQETPPCSAIVLSTRLQHGYLLHHGVPHLCSFPSSPDLGVPSAYYHSFCSLLFLPLCNPCCPKIHFPRAPVWLKGESVSCDGAVATTSSVEGNPSLFSWRPPFKALLPAQTAKIRQKISKKNFFPNV